MKRALKALGLLVLVAAVVIAVLAALFGLRVVLDGGARPHLVFVRTAGEQAEAVARHRETQRTDPAAPVVPAPAVEAPPGAPAPAPAAEPPVWSWAEFRGPARDGRYRGPIRTNWPVAGLAPIWRQPAGGGYASFAVAGGRAFTIEQRGPQEVVAAYDVATGRELWAAGWAASFEEFMGGDGPRATPTWAAGVVYALGAEGELRALDDATGRTIWRTNMLDDHGAGNLPWGMAASPLVVGDTVVVLPGGPGGHSVAAYDRRTGAKRWSALDDKQAYTAPMLATLAGEPHLLVFGGSRLMGLRPDTGDLLWSHPWSTQADIHAAQPLVIGDDRVFLSSGYGVGAAVLEIVAGPEGLTAREVWRNTRMKNRFASSVLHEGFIYGLDEAILACVDAATGELRWKGGRYGHGQLVLAGGHLIVLAENGDLALVRATPDGHEERVRFPALAGKTWNVPSFADGILLVRNLQEMAAFDLRPPAR